MKEKIKNLEDRFAFGDKWFKKFHKRCDKEAGIHGFAKTNKGIAHSTYAIIKKKLGA